MTDDGHREPRILIDDRQGDVRVDHEPLAELARAVLIGEGVDRSELSLSFVTEHEITDLHERYMREDGPTDVLSFPLEEEDVDEEGIRLVGDVVICPAVAIRNRPDDPPGELRLLVVHGILHLLGHDHTEKAQRGEMWAKQERYTGVHVP